jgi:hypothetical protein
MEGAMRKLPLLLIVVLLALLALATSAPALSLPAVPGALALTPSDEGEEAEASDEGEFEAVEDDCVVEDEEDVEICAEIEAEERESEEAEVCVIEDASAKLAPQPGNDTVKLAIRYRSLAPAAVLVEARLRGSKGRLRLGADHAHLRRAGVYRKSFILSEGKMDRALDAREFEVELQALNTPRYCRLDLNGAPRRARH